MKTMSNRQLVSTLCRSCETLGRVNAHPEMHLKPGEAVPPMTVENAVRSHLIVALGRKVQACKGELIRRLEGKP